MGQQLVAIATLVIIGAIIADLIFHPQGTGVLVNGISGLWRNGLQAAAGQTVH